MARRRLTLALLITVVVAACGSTATPAPSSGVSAAPIDVAAVSPSPASPSATSSPLPTVAPTDAPTAPPAPTATPAPTPAPTVKPAAFRLFTGKRYHYTMQYPRDWVATPGSATFSDQFDGFGYPYVYVSRDTVNGSVSLSRTVTSVIANVKSHYKAKLTSNSSITLYGWKGRLLKFTGTDNGVKVAIQEIVIAKGSAVYFIDLYGELKDAVADRTLFRKMYLTWRPTR